MDITAVSFDTLRADEREDLAALYNRCFPVPAGASFLDDFPVWDPAIAVADRIQLAHRRNGKIVASSSARFAELKPAGEKIAIIGAVVTDPALRGQGLATRAIESLLREVEARAPQAIFLWGSEKNLYGKFGFDYGGRQCRARLGDLRFTASEAGASKLEIQDGWSSEVQGLMNARKDGIRLQDSDRDWLARHRNVLFFRLVRDGRCTAYAACGRGIDLTRMVHDWAGDERDLGLLLSVIAREDPDLEILFHPRHEQEFGFLRGVENRIEERLCMARLGASPPDLESTWFYGLDSC